MKSPQHIVALFAGVGGIERGLHRAGHRVLEFCENDEGAQEVLRKRFRGVPIVADVKDYRRGHRMPDGVTCITAGFPCQDLSQAGTTLGLDGKRSGLIEELFWILRHDRKTEWLVLENVPFMLRLGRGRAIGLILKNLEILGYSWAYRIVDTRSFGLPQRRKRVFLLASLSSDPREVLLSQNAIEPEEPFDPDGKACGFYWTEGTRGLGWAVDATPTLKGGSSVGIPSPPAIWCPGVGMIRIGIRDAERLQGFEADWTQPAEAVVRPSFRWRLVGNAVTVNVSSWLGERLRAPLPYDGTDDEPLSEKAPWPNAAYNVGEGRFRSNSSGYPVRVPRPHLVDFVNLDEAQPLSLRATRGFHDRFDKSTLRRPPGFMEALEKHLEEMKWAQKEPVSR